MEQVVTIQLEDENKASMGKLSISAINYNNKEYAEISPQNGLTLKNVPLVEKPDNTTPITYIDKPDKQLSNLLLLEETEYQILYEHTNTSSTFNVLNELKKQEFTHKPFKKLRFNMVDENHYRCAGTLNFRSYVGKSFLDVIKGETRSIPVPIEVRSKKIDYYQQYPQMIGDLSEYASGMIFESRSPLHQEFKIDDASRETLYEDFMFLEYLFRPENLPSTFEYLTHNLYSRLENYTESVPTSVVSNIGANELINIINTPEKLTKNNNTKLKWNQQLKGYIPQEIREIRYQDTIDTPENRFFKNFLELIESLLYTLLKKQTQPGYIKENLLSFEDELNYYLSQKWMKDISKMEYAPLNSQVLQKKEGYRDILHYFLMLEFSFKLSWEEITTKFIGYEKRLSELYEYWCYFKILNVLNNISETKINFEDIYEINKDQWSIKIKKGKNSQQKFQLTQQDKKIHITLMYNRKFSTKTKHRSYSLLFKPDYTLQIQLDNKQFFIHFDAKYRSELEILDIYNKIGEEEAEKEAEKRDEEEEILHKFKNGDIYKMHTYKDAILQTEGAYVLYPGDNCKVFREKEFLIPSVGAFPLNPGRNEEETLTIFIKKIIQKIIGEL